MADHSQTNNLGRDNQPSYASSQSQWNSQMTNIIEPENLKTVESEVTKLVDVVATRIILDSQYVPTEIHVVSIPNKTPKQVSKDVHSILLASFGLSIDHRIISIVQIGVEASKNSNSESNSKARVIIERVVVEKHKNMAIARVSLRQGEYLSEGFAQGSIASSTRNRLVAQATLDSLTQLLGIEVGLDVVSSEIISAQNHRIGVAVVMLVDSGYEESLAGSAIINEEDPSLSIAKAVLSATNRRLALINT